METERLYRSGEKIKLARTRKGLSQEKLGELLEMSGMNIGRIEKGRINPTVEQYKKLADVLDADVIDLMCLKDEAGADHVDKVSEGLVEYGSAVKSGQKQDIDKAVTGLIESLNTILKSVKGNE